MTLNNPDYLVGQCHRCGGTLTLIRAYIRGVVCNFCGETREVTDDEHKSVMAWRPPVPTS